MGLDKDTASARISRYESESMAVSLESLFSLAGALAVPPAYLLASSAVMADAILLIDVESEAQQAQLLQVLSTLASLPATRRKALLEKILGKIAP